MSFLLYFLYICAMEKFQVHILGCGSALPTRHHLPASQVVSLRGKLFMMDCGEGAQLQCRRSHLKFANLNHIFLSHLHGDHCFGLIGLISTFGLQNRTSDLHIYGPVGLQEALQPQLDFFCTGIPYRVVMHEVSTKHSEVIFEDRSVSVTTIPLKHRVPCCGYLFREVQSLPHIRRDMIDFLKIPHYAINSIKEGAGWTTEEGKFFPHERLVTPAKRARSYAYLSDTTYLPQNAELVKGVDLLFHESTFLDRDKSFAKQTFHSTTKQAAEFAKMADVGRLMLGHYSSRYDDDNLFLEEAKEIFPNTILANEGLVVEV